jgi:serine/threonine-protein kinase
VLFGRAIEAIWAVPPEGPPAAVTAVAEAEVAHALPWPLPGGQTLLFTVRKRVWSWGDEEIVAQNLVTGERKVLLKDGADARYLPTGHLVFLRRGVLFAVPFDAAGVRVSGKETPVLDTVAQALTSGQEANITGAGQFAIAATGTLAWLPGSVVPYPDTTLVAVDRRGRVSPLSGPARPYIGPWVSPDGRQLAVGIQRLTEAGVWTYDLDRGTLRLLAGGGEATYVRWSPDGRSLVFDWLADGRRTLARQPVDGSASPQALVTGGRFNPSSFTPDGRQVAIVKEPDWDILSLTLDGGHARLQPLIQTPHSEGWPEFSPDGRWLAYGSNVSGRFEVYVRPSSGPGPSEQVSLDGGSAPAWGRAGQELFFVGLEDARGRNRMMAVDFSPGSPPGIDRPRALFEFDARLLPSCAPVRCFDVAPDGQRFYGAQYHTLLPATPVTHINLILNWFEELKTKLPASGVK